ncbi:uncharacterized protein LOC133806895 [Humulus lupulus]|uniref:uncharacterized protein LOC133806895 n=1 Tax=Humulus lupulus TaxID=3486 RepID=UPI002B40165A|nr:uncharacterized protein LOC133806895 [Humulus lupulus]
MASANIFDIYSTQEEEEVPLVRKKKSTRKHDGEPSQMPSAKRNRATDPSTDGPSGQTSVQPPAPHEQEILPPPTPAATNPSPPAPTEQTQQAEGVPPGAKLSGRSLRSAKDRLAHILKHDRCKEAMAEAMLTMMAARARAGTSIEQSRARESKLMEELRAAEARHAGEMEVVTQQKDSLVADLVEKQASLESARKQREEYQEASRIHWHEVKKLQEENLVKDRSIVILKSQKHNQSANFGYLPEDARKAELACCAARLAAEERARVPASPEISLATGMDGGEAAEDTVNQNAPQDPPAAP